MGKALWACSLTWQQVKTCGLRCRLVMHGGDTVCALPASKSPCKVCLVAEVPTGDGKALWAFSLT